MNSPFPNSNYSVSLANGHVVLPDPIRRIRKYCELEVYDGFDDCTVPDNVISIHDIETSRRIFSMFDQYGFNESAHVLSSDVIRKSLSVIPNWDITAISDNEWIEVKGDLRLLFGAFLAIDHVGLAKAGKIIHIKRPKLVPILDSYVVNLLTGLNPANVYPKTSLLSLGMHALEIARNDIIRNREFYHENAELNGQRIPIGGARAYDILCWTHWKWNVKNMRTTTRWKKTDTGYVQVKDYVGDLD